MLDTHGRALLWVLPGAGRWGQSHCRGAIRAIEGRGKGEGRGQCTPPLPCRPYWLPYLWSAYVHVRRLPTSRQALAVKKQWARSCCLAPLNRKYAGPLSTGAHLARFRSCPAPVPPPAMLALYPLAQYPSSGKLSVRMWSSPALPPLPSGSLLGPLQGTTAMVESAMLPRTATRCPSSPRNEMNTTRATVTQPVGGAYGDHSSAVCAMIAMPVERGPRPLFLTANSRYCPCHQTEQCQARVGAHTRAILQTIQTPLHKAHTPMLATEHIKKRGINRGVSSAGTHGVCYPIKPDCVIQLKQQNGKDQRK